MVLLGLGVPSHVSEDPSSSASGGVGVGAKRGLMERSSLSSFAGAT